MTALKRAIQMYEAFGKEEAIREAYRRVDLAEQENNNVLLQHYTDVVLILDNI